LNTPYVSSEGSPNRAATPLAERRGGDRRDLLALGSLIVLACALRLPGLASRSLWVDEAWRANVALASSWSGFWNDVLGSGRIEAPMPPLYALALRLIGMVVGHSAGGLRASSLAASVAAIPLAYVLGRHARGPVAGIAAAMAFACYPAAVTYGRELKPYAFDVLVVLAVLVCAARTIARRDRASWILLAAMTALAPGLSYPAILVLPGVALGLLATCRDRRDFRRWLATEVFATLSLLVWYVLVIAVQRQRPGVVAYWGGAFPSFTASGATAVLAAGTELIEFAAGTPAWLFALAVALGFFSTPRWLRLATLGTVTTVVVVGFLRMYPLSGGRTSLFLLPFIYVALAVAAAALIPAARGEARAASHGRRVATVSRVLAAMAAVVVLALPLRGASHPDAGLVYEETAPLISWLTAERKPDDRVYVYYAAGPAFLFYHPEVDPGVTMGGLHRGDAGAYEAEVRPLLAPSTRIWILFAHVFTPRDGASERDTILDAVRLCGRQLEARETVGASLHLFEVIRAANQVRHIQIRPEDAANPDRLRELLGK